MAGFAMKDKKTNIIGKGHAGKEQCCIRQTIDLVERTLVFLDQYRHRPMIYKLFLFYHI